VDEWIEFTLKNAEDPSPGMYCYPSPVTPTSPDETKKEINGLLRGSAFLKIPGPGPTHLLSGNEWDDPEFLNDAGRIIVHSCHFGYRLSRVYTMVQRSGVHLWLRRC
jgi:hypothetical protein